MRIPSNKISDIIRFFRNELRDLYSSEETEVMIAWCFEDFCGISRNMLHTQQHSTVNESDLLKFSSAVKGLKAHKPIQYILGTADFYGMKFRVNEHVLIPRPETEELVDLIIRENPGASSILDIGTGSGCIAISLAKHLKGAKVSAIDISPDALKIAGSNAVLNAVDIALYQSDVLADELPGGPYNIIVSNPPYVADSEKSSMEKNVLDYEPHLALFVNGSDPLLFYKRIILLAKKKLADKGGLYFEINPLFADELADIMRSQGFHDVSLRKDINNKNRILRGYQIAH